MKTTLSTLRNLLTAPANRPWLLLLALLVLITLALAPLFPHRVTPASASLERFSAARAMGHLPIIAREAHPSGSPAQAVVRDYLVEQLSSLGLETQVQAYLGHGERGRPAGRPRPERRHPAAGALRLI